MKKQLFPKVRDSDCRRVRVAEGEIAAVDRCGCGVFQLHLGAFTLRLAPEALWSLYETLGVAVSADAAANETATRADEASPGELTEERTPWLRLVHPVEPPGRSR